MFQNKLGDTPLHAASWKGYSDIVEMLLNKSEYTSMLLFLCLKEYIGQQGHLCCFARNSAGMNGKKSPEIFYETLRWEHAASVRVDNK